jgi:hypothetical protein
VRKCHPSAQALIAAYRTAVKGCSAAEEKTSALTNRVLGTLVTMPEFPNSHFATAYSLDCAANIRLNEQGLTSQSPKARRLLARVESYKAILAQLQALRAEWEEVSGLTAAYKAENLAYERKERAWTALLARLEGSAKDRNLIARFLATDAEHGGPSEPWRLRAAFKVISKGAR